MQPFRRVARGAVLVSIIAVPVTALAACGGSSSPKPSPSPPAPVAIASCAASVIVPPDSIRVVPAARVPPTAVVRTGSALSFALASGSTVGLGAPVGRGDGAVLCRASTSSTGTVTLVGRQPGFVRVAVAGGPQPQRIVNVQVTV